MQVMKVLTDEEILKCETCLWRNPDTCRICKAEQEEKEVQNENYKRLPICNR